MQTKIVYAIASKMDGLYFEQAYISMTSLRIYNPEAWVILVVDDFSNRVLENKLFSFDSLINEKKVIEIINPKLTTNQRSRWLKTSLREHIQGDFLFIDADTVICSKLDEIDEFESDMGAVPDFHVSLVSNPFSDLYLVPQCKTIKHVPYQEKFYFNSGVICVKDNEKTRNFYDRWHKDWKRGIIYGINYDQPTFNKTNHMFGSMIKELHGSWNCQLKFGLPFYGGTIKILHYLITFKGIENIHYMTNSNIYEHLANTGKIDDITINVIKNPLWNFISPVVIIGKRELDFQTTSIARIVMNLYYKRKILFTIINKIASLVFKLEEFINTITVKLKYRYSRKKY